MRISHIQPMRELKLVYTTPWASGVRAGCWASVSIACSALRPVRRCSRCPTRRLSPRSSTATPSASATTRIRLEGIDAPEAGADLQAQMVRLRGHAGTRRRRRWSGSDRTSRLRCDPRGLDKYGRTLAVCFVDGRDINAADGAPGLCLGLRQILDELREGGGGGASAESLGIWQGEATPAWDYRASRWAAAEHRRREGCAIKGNVTKNGRIYHMPWSPWYAQIQHRAGQGQALVLHRGRGPRRGLAAGADPLSKAARTGIGAGDGDRTHDPDLGKVVLYR